MRCIKCGENWHHTIKKCKNCGGELTPLSTIICVDATEIPAEVEDYCIDNEISIHSQNDITVIENDGNAFAEWLKENGYKFKSKDGDYIGIIAS